MKELGVKQHTPSELTKAMSSFLGLCSFLNLFSRMIYIFILILVFDYREEIEHKKFLILVIGSVCPLIWGGYIAICGLSISISTIRTWLKWKSRFLSKYIYISILRVFSSYILYIWGNQEDNKGYIYLIFMGSQIMGALDALLLLVNGIAIFTFHKTIKKNIKKL